jgi:hypothetical protein
MKNYSFLSECFDFSFTSTEKTLAPKKILLGPWKLLLSVLTILALGTDQLSVHINEILSNLQSALNHVNQG